MKKRIISLLLVFSLMVSLFTPITQCYAATTQTKKYTGKIGIAWVRNMSKSPSTLAEMISGSYTVEVDYLTYNTCAIIRACADNYSLWKDTKSLIESAGLTAASAYIAEAVGIASNAALSSALGIIMGFEYSFLTTIDDRNFESAWEDMKSTNYMRVAYTTCSAGVVRSYSAYKSTTVKGMEGKTGDWHVDKYGVICGI